MAKDKPTASPIVIDERDGHFYLTADRSATDVEGVGIAYKRVDAELFSVSAEMLNLLHDVVTSDGTRPGHVAYMSRSDIAAAARAIITKLSV